MISYVVVNYNSYDFLFILLKSIKKFSSISYEVIVIDNSFEKKTLDFANVFFYFQNFNIGHGEGLNLGIKEANGEYVLLLDVDCHFLCHDFDKMLISKKEDIITVPGTIKKPIRPAFFFSKKDIIKNYNFNSTLNYKGNRITPNGYDVGILAYYKMLEDNRTFFWMDKKPNRYQTLNGEEWCIEDVPIVYHHWHGSHLKERQVDFPNNDLIKDKETFMRKINIEFDC